MWRTRQWSVIYLKAESTYVGCVQQSDRLSHEIYEALKTCLSKVLLYVCTCCQKKGSVIKRLHEYEVENKHAYEQRLASTQTNERLSKLVGALREEKQALAIK